MSKVHVFADLYRKEVQRRRTEEPLKASEKRIRAIIENATNAFVGMNEQGIIEAHLDGCRTIVTIECNSARKW